jgi:hypothetical protein
MFAYASNSFSAIEIFTSPKEKVSLIELYTSEGCSSCPPAEAWMNSLKEEPGLWNKFIPLAFHVAYWDYLGWKDHMGSVKNAQRQRQYAASWGSITVYTPGIVRNGKEWREWRGQKTISGTGIIASGSVRLKWKGDGEAEVSYSDSSDPLIAHVALLGFGIKTDVQRGENRGRVLEHEFVVLEHVSHKMNKSLENGLVSKIKIQKDKFSDVKEFGLVAWVSEESNLVPLQATGGFIN